MDIHSGLFVKGPITDPFPQLLQGSAGPLGLGGGEISLSDRLLKRSRVRGLAAASQPAIVRVLFPSNLHIFCQLGL